MTKATKPSRLTTALRSAFLAALLLSSLMSWWAAWQVARKVTKLETEVYLLRVVPVPGGILPQFLETPDGQVMPFRTQGF